MMKFQLLCHVLPCAKCLFQVIKIHCSFWCLFACLIFEYSSQPAKICFYLALSWLLMLFSISGLKKNQILGNLIEENVIQFGLNVIWTSFSALEPKRIDLYWAYV